MTSPSLTSSGAGRSRSPARVEEHHAAAAARRGSISRGDPALGPEGHAPDIALGDVEEAKTSGRVVEAALQTPPGFEGVSLLDASKANSIARSSRSGLTASDKRRQSTRFRDPGLLVSSFLLGPGILVCSCAITF